MREILFRGKQLYKNTWAYGGIRKYCGCIEILPEEGPCKITVYKDTVGQYTGLIDKNGKKIFEGDIVKYRDEGYIVNGVVLFGLYASAGATFAGHEGFYLEWAEDDGLRKDIGFWATKRPLEVIGNIHDNPELMEDE